MDFFDKHIDRLIPDEELKKDSISYRKYRTLILFQALVFPTLAFFIIDNTIKNLHVINIGAFTFLLINFFSIYSLLKIQKYDFSANLYIGGLFIFLFFANLDASFNPTSQLSWFFLFPLLPTLLLSPKAGFRWTLFSVTVVIGSILYFHHFPFLNARLTPQLLFESSLADQVIGPFLIYILAKSALFVREVTITNLEDANEEVTNAFKDKRELLSILFHDLNNHLMLGISSANRIGKNGFSENDFEKIANSLEHMQEIIKNVKELEMVKNGKLKMTLEEVDIFEILKEAQEVFAERLAKKGQEIVIVNEGEVKNKVLSHRVALTNNILFNILSNAMKFSPENTNILIMLKTLDEDKLRIKIKDQGMGIPKELLEDIFNYTKATNRKGTDGEKGTGFGMPILKSTLERIGGEISIESQAREDGFTDTYTAITIVLKNLDPNQANIKRLVV